MWGRLHYAWLGCGSMGVNGLEVCKVHVQTHSLAWRDCIWGRRIKFPPPRGAVFCIYFSLSCYRASWPIASCTAPPILYNARTQQSALAFSQLSAPRVNHPQKGISLTPLVLSLSHTPEEIPKWSSDDCLRNWFCFHRFQTDSRLIGLEFFAPTMRILDSIPEKVS
jgi:hypothetical protein